MRRLLWLSCLLSQLNPRKLNKLGSKKLTSLRALLQRAVSMYLIAAHERYILEQDFNVRKVYHK